MGAGIGNLINATGKLPIGNFTFEQLDTITSGKHNIGLLKLDDSGQLVKFNNHVWKTDQNNVANVAAENIAVRNAVFKSIKARYEKETGSEFASCLEAVRKELLGDERMDLPLSRKEVRVMLNQFKALATNAAKESKVDNMKSTIKELDMRIADLELTQKGVNAAINEAKRNVPLLKECLSSEAQISKLEKQRSSLLETCEIKGGKGWSDVLKHLESVCGKLKFIKEMRTCIGGFGDAKEFAANQSFYRKHLFKYEDKFRQALAQNESDLQLQSLEEQIDRIGETDNALRDFKSWMDQNVDLTKSAPNVKASCGAWFASVYAKKCSDGQDVVGRLEAKQPSLKGASILDLLQSYCNRRKVLADRSKVLNQLQALKNADRDKGVKEEAAAFESRIADLDKLERETVDSLKGQLSAKEAEVQAELGKLCKDHPDLAKLVELDGKIKEARQKYPDVPTQLKLTANLKNRMDEMDAFIATHGKAQVKTWNDLIAKFETAERGLLVGTMLKVWNAQAAEDDVEAFVMAQSEILKLRQSPNPAFREFRALRQHLINARADLVFGVKDWSQSEDFEDRLRTFINAFPEKKTLSEWDVKLREHENAQRELAQALREKKANSTDQNALSSYRAAERRFNDAEKAVRDLEETSGDFRKFRLLRQQALDARQPIVDDAAVEQKLGIFNQGAVSRLKSEKSSLESEIKALKKQKAKVERQLLAEETKVVSPLSLADFLSAIRREQPSTQRKEFLADLMKKYRSFESCRPILEKIGMMLQREDNQNGAAFSDNPLTQEFKTKATELLEAASKGIDGPQTTFKHLIHLDTELKEVDAKLAALTARQPRAQAELQKAKTDLSTAKTDLSAAKRELAEVEKRLEAAEESNQEGLRTEQAAKQKVVDQKTAAVDGLQKTIDRLNTEVKGNKKQISELSATSKKYRAESLQTTDLIAKANAAKKAGQEKVAGLEAELVQIAQKDSPRIRWRLLFVDLTQRYGSDPSCAPYLKAVEPIFRDAFDRHKVFSADIAGKANGLFETLIKNKPSEEDLDEQEDFFSSEVWSAEGNWILKDLETLCKDSPVMEGSPSSSGVVAVAGKQLHELRDSMTKALKDNLTATTVQLISSHIETAESKKSLSPSQISELARNIELAPLDAVGQAIITLVDPLRIGNIEDSDFKEQLYKDSKAMSKLLSEQLKLAGAELDRLAERAKIGGGGVRKESDYHTFLRKAAEIFATPAPGISFYAGKVREQLAAALLALGDDNDFRINLDEVQDVGRRRVQEIEDEGASGVAEVKAPSPNEVEDFLAGIGDSRVVVEDLLNIRNGPDDKSLHDLATVVLGNVQRDLQNVEWSNGSAGIDSLVKLAQEGIDTLAKRLDDGLAANQVASFVSTFEQEFVAPIERWCCEILGVENLGDYLDDRIQQALVNVRMVLREIGENPAGLAGKKTDLKRMYSSLTQAIKESVKDMMGYVAGCYLEKTALHMIDRLEKATNEFGAIIDRTTARRKVLAAAVDDAGKMKNPERFLSLFEQEFLQPFERECCALLNLEDFSEFPVESVRSAAAGIRKLLGKAGMTPGWLGDSAHRIELKEACDGLLKALTAALADMKKQVDNNVTAIVNCIKPEVLRTFAPTPMMIKRGLMHVRKNANSYLGVPIDGIKGISSAEIKTVEESVDRLLRLDNHARRPNDTVGDDLLNAYSRILNAFAEAAKSQKNGSAVDGVLQSHIKALARYFRAINPSRPEPAAPVEVQPPKSVEDRIKVTSELEHMEQDCLKIVGEEKRKSKFAQHALHTSLDSVWATGNVGPTTCGEALAQQLGRIRIGLQSLPKHAKSKLNFKAPGPLADVAQLVEGKQVQKVEEGKQVQKVEEGKQVEEVILLNKDPDLQLSLAKIEPTFSTKSVGDLALNNDDVSKLVEFIAQSGKRHREGSKAADTIEGLEYGKELRAAEVARIAYDRGRKASDAQSVEDPEMKWLRQKVLKAYLPLKTVDDVSRISQSVAQFERQYGGNLEAENVGDAGWANITNALKTVKAAVEAFASEHANPKAKPADLQRLHQAVVTAYSTLQDLDTVRLIGQYAAKIKAQVKGETLKSALEAITTAQTNYFNAVQNPQTAPDAVKQTYRAVQAAYSALQTAVDDENLQRITVGVTEFETTNEGKLKSADFKAVSAALALVKDGLRNLTALRQQTDAKPKDVATAWQDVQTAFANLQKSPFRSEVANYVANVSSVGLDFGAMFKHTGFGNAPDTDVKGAMKAFKSATAKFDAECGKPNVNRAKLDELLTAVREAYSNLKGVLDLAFKDEEVRQTGLFASLAERRIMELLGLGPSDKIPDDNVVKAIDDVRSAVEAYDAMRRDTSDKPKDEAKLRQDVQKAYSNLQKTLDTLAQSVGKELTDMVGIVVPNPKLTGGSDYSLRGLEEESSKRNEELVQVRRMLNDTETKVFSGKGGENYSEFFRGVFHTVSNTVWKLKNVTPESCDILVLDDFWGNKNIKKSIEALDNLKGSLSVLDQAYKTSNFSEVESILLKLQDLSNAFGLVQFKFGTMDGDTFRTNLAKAWDCYYRIEDLTPQANDHMMLYNILTEILDAVEKGTGGSVNGYLANGFVD